MGSAQTGSPFPVPTQAVIIVPITEMSERPNFGTIRASSLGRNAMLNNNGNGGVVGRGGGNKNTVLQFWQSQEMRSGNNIAKAFLL